METKHELEKTYSELKKWPLNLHFISYIGNFLSPSNHHNSASSDYGRKDSSGHIFSSKSRFHHARSIVYYEGGCFFFSHFGTKMKRAASGNF